MNFPVIGSIRNFQDVKRALEAIRSYFSFTDLGDLKSGGGVKDSNIAEFQGNNGKRVKDGGISHAEVAEVIVHKGTEDAINGLVSVNGAGGYSPKVIGTDVQAYNAQTTVQGNKVTLTQPANGSILTVDEGKILRASETWELSVLVTGESGNALDTTKHVTVNIGGVPVKLAVIQ